MSIIQLRSRQPQPRPLVWPTQSVGYKTTLPNHGSYGMDANGGGLGSTIIFVTSLANTNSGASAPALGTNVYTGTWEYAWRFDNSATGTHKIIVPLVSGYVQYGRSVNSTAGVGNFSYWGHAAPGEGLCIRQGPMRINGGSDVRIWHGSFWCGDDAGSPPADNRDCLQVGNSSYTPSQVCIINTECLFGIDELFEGFYAIDLLTCLYSVFAEPLHVPPDFLHSGDPVGTDHGFGPIIGGGGFVDRVAFYRNLFAHSTDRGPLTAANRYAHANNLHYNHGRPGGGTGKAVNIIDNGGYNAAVSDAMDANIVGNMFVKGPENVSAKSILGTQGTLSTGSTGFLAGNIAAGGWSITDQADFFFSPPVGYLQSSLRTSWPTGWGANYEGTLTLAADPLNPTLAERIAFAQLICSSVGPKPGVRTSRVSRMPIYRRQIENAIAGIPQSAQFINGVADVTTWPVTDGTGWPDIPNLTISDPTAPGSDWYAPIPLGSDRDDALVSGTFSNGASKVGYTKLEAWCIEQHYYVGGK